jgi:hypothetical protein
LRWVQLAFIHLAAAVLGVRAGLHEHRTAHDVLFGYILAIVIVMACANDARLRGLWLPRIEQFLMIFTWPVTAPTYLLWSRRWWGVLWVLGLGMTMTLCYLVPAIVVFALRWESTR